MRCNKQETVICAYLGALKVQVQTKQNWKSIQVAMGGFYPDGKVWNQPRVVELAKETLFKEPFVEHRILPRGKLNEHYVCITDREKCVKKVKKMLGGFKIWVWGFDETLVKQFLN